MLMNALLQIESKAEKAGRDAADASRKLDAVLANQQRILQYLGQRFDSLESRS